MPGDRIYIDVNGIQYLIPPCFLLDMLDELLHEKLEDGQVTLQWRDVVRVDDDFDFAGPEHQEQ